MKPVDTQEKSSSHDVVVEFYRDHFHRFVADLRAKFGSGPPDPEDVAQQAFEKLLNHSSGDDPIRSVKAYLWMVCRNIIISDLRSQKTAKQRDIAYFEQKSDQEGFVLSPERVLASREQLSIVQFQLRKMPDRRRKSFLLMRVHGLSQTEVARELGISRTAVSKHVAKATQEILSVLFDDHRSQ
ncbi:MAG: sigma-70 family RNA polymerase sigma factor [Pseudomonadota bacterium]